ncbi:MAG: hypothetical protein M3151_03720 [Actinomycetota bacterium]|nr:hypothetical protein [Actinomycetota bacterium]
MVRAVFLDIDGALMDANYLRIEARAQAFDGVRARASLVLRPGAHDEHHMQKLGAAAVTTPAGPSAAPSWRRRGRRGP